MMADPNVAKNIETEYMDVFNLSEKIKSVVWLDNGAELEFLQENGITTIKTEPFPYGRDLVVRVAKIVCD